MDTVSAHPRAMRFGPLEIEWAAGVIAPRPWTLLQSEWAAELAHTAEPGPLLELCAGAGHIGLAAAVLARRDLVQVEADQVAADCAVRNAARAGWSSRTQLRVGDLRTALQAGERFPIVLADPPYLPTRQVSRWPDDPPTAIDGGPDGLNLVRACLSVAGSHVATSGAVLLQVAGERQADEVRDILDRATEPALRAVEVRSADDERAVLLLRARPA